MAKADTAKLVKVAPRWPKRKAAHKRGGTIRYTLCPERKSIHSEPPKTKIERATTIVASEPFSSQLLEFHKNRFTGTAVANTKMAGANVKSLMTSPTHHCSQV